MSKAAKILLVLVVVLVGVRVALPSIIKSQINKKLHQTPGYDGQVGDVDLSLLAGNTALKSVHIVKKSETNNKETPFLDAPRIDLSFRWKPLFHKQLVCAVGLDHPKMTYLATHETKPKEE